MDKRRYLSRSPNKTRKTVTMDEHRTGNPALDGYSVRSRNTEDDMMPRSSRFDGDVVADSLMDETEANFQRMFKD